MKKLKRFLLLTVSLIIVVSCQSTIRFSTDETRAAIQNAPPPAGKVITGKASYYAEDFHGRKTSNGETYDMYAMTAAHKTLPFNTLVKVTNLNNSKSVIVRINDRGPFKPGRVLDLSKGAAQKLNMTGAGVVPVKIEVLGNDVTKKE